MAGPGGREVGRLSVRVLPDTSNFATSLQRYLDRIERRARLQIHVDSNMDAFAQQVESRLQEISNNAQVSVDVEAAEGSMDDLENEVNETLDDTNEDVNERGDEMGRSLGQRMSEGLRDMGGRIASALGAILKGPAIKAAVMGAGAIVGSTLASAISIALGGISVVYLSAKILKDVPKIENAFKRMKDRIKGVFRKAAEPMIGPLAEAMDSIGDTFEDLAPQIEKMFQITADSGILKSLTDGLEDFLTNFMPGFNDMLEHMKPVFEGLEELMGQVGKGLGEFFKEVGKSAPEAKILLEDLGKAIKNGLIYAGKIIAFLTKLYVKFHDAKKAAEELWGKFTQNVKDAWNDVKLKFAEIILWFKTLPDRVSEGLTLFKNMVRNKFNEAKEKAVSKVNELLFRVVAFLSSLPDRAYNALSGWAGKMLRRADEAGDSLIDGARRKLDEAVDYIRDFPGNAVDALGNLTNYLFGSGVSLVAGFIDGMLSMLGGIGRAAGRLLSKARAYFPFSPAKTGPFSGRGWVLYSGRSVAEGFAKGISDYQSMVERASSGLAAVGRGPLVDAVVNGSDVPAGLLPGDTLALTLDGQTTLEAVIQRGAKGAIHQTLAGPLRRGRSFA